MKTEVIYRLASMSREDYQIHGYRFGSGKPRVAIVAGMRGSEAQGLYVAAKLVQYLKQNEQAIASGSEILVIPSVNPYSLNTVHRLWPLDHTDINRMFPGYSKGETTQRIAAAVMEAVQDYELGVNLTSTPHPGKHVVHARIHRLGTDSVEAAVAFGLPFVHEHEANPQETGSLNYNWQIWNTRAVSLAGGRGFEIDEDQVLELFHGVLRFLVVQGVLPKNVVPVEALPLQHRHSRVVQDTDICVVTTPRAGIFSTRCRPGDSVQAGEVLAEILDPHVGEVRYEIRSPITGTAFYVYRAPLVYEKMIALMIV
ncbi:MAG: succinylglutamate desuccinylase [Spirochaetaceae bacterium]|nr:MAG: succinylglutamate desuccinylase [Spirochaetaceae bacterium]